MFKFVCALFVSAAAGFSPAAVGSRLVQSVVTPAAAPLAAQAVARVPELAMSAVTERDADGNPVVHAEM